MIPKIFVFSVITFISTVYFAFGLEGINSTVERILPEKIFAVLVRIKNGFISVGIKYIRSYTFIMLITFAIMLVGFLILRVAHAPLVALLVALLDLLPVIGVGTVLIPWSIISFVQGNTTIGIALIILTIFETVIRQLIEPKIIGRSVDLHPIVMLFSVYAGSKLLGVWGILGGPAVAVAIKFTYPVLFPSKKEDGPDVK